MKFTNEATVHRAGRLIRSNRRIATLNQCSTHKMCTSIEGVKHEQSSLCKKYENISKL